MVFVAFHMAHTTSINSTSQGISCNEDGERICKKRIRGITTIHLSSFAGIITLKKNVQQNIFYVRICIIPVMALMQSYDMPCHTFLHLPKVLCGFLLLHQTMAHERYLHRKCTRERHENRIMSEGKNHKTQQYNTTVCVEMCQMHAH